MLNSGLTPGIFQLGAKAAKICKFSYTALPNLLRQQPKNFSSDKQLDATDEGTVAPPHLSPGAITAANKSLKLVCENVTSNRWYMAEAEEKQN